MQATQPAYFAAYRSLKLSRDARGVLVVEFHTIADVHIFEREHDHTGGSCWSDSDDDDLTDGAARHVSHVDIRTFGLRHPVALDRRRTFLGIFRGRSRKRKSVDGVCQVG